MPKRILIVDDEDKVVFFLRESLLDLEPDCEVVGTTSSTDALSEINRAPIDLLIADLCLPRVTGLDLAVQLQARSPQAGVIIMSGYSSDEARSAARQLHITHFFDKPFHVDDLLRAAGELLA